jgi:hypothetical protein
MSLQPIIDQSSETLNSRDSHAKCVADIFRLLTPILTDDGLLDQEHREAERAFAALQRLQGMLSRPAGLVTRAVAAERVGAGRPDVPV